MNAIELITLVTHALYVIVFVLVLVRTLRRPTPAHADVTAFFGVTALIILQARLQPLFGSTPPAWVSETTSTLLMALPYILLRLVDDFAGVRPALMRAGEIGLLLSAIGIFASGGHVAAVPALGMVAYFVALSIYCALRFVRASRRSHGVTRRRLEAISFGAIMLGLDLFLVGATLLFTDPLETSIVNTLTNLAGLGSAIAFYIGFAPPSVLRHAWQAPDLRRFLARAAELPRLPTTRDVVRELERGAAATTGSDARVGVWDERTGKLRMWTAADTVYEFEPGRLIAGKAFAEQRTIFTVAPSRDDPDGAATYRESRVGAAIATPISAGDTRLGVLTFFSERPPIFAVSDIELARLLADQAAVVLESRQLIDHAARVKAQEEAARLKEDFVSAAAHDLKTPLTTVVAQAEFLARKAARDPNAPVDVEGLRRIVRESKRLAALVSELLDAARLDQGRFVTDREPLDLAALVTDVVDRQPEDMHEYIVDIEDTVVGSYDRRRIEQLVENLVENARKYSPHATPVRVRLWTEGDEARLSVRDEGIGIPASDVVHIFDRFARGSNVDDRRFHGMGLGLYICRGIVTEHGGRIWVESEVGKGSTFHVALPLAGVPAGREKVAVAH